MQAAETHSPGHGQTATVVLEGDCTVARAEEIRALLLEALKSGGPLVLDMRAVTAIDLSFCQILHALHRSCAGRDLTCLNSPALDEALAESARRCGLPDLTGARPDGSA